MTAQTAPFRADTVGSFLRPIAIKNAREQYAAGQIDKTELTRIEDEAIRDVVSKQIANGLQVVTDGEFRRAWWHFDFFGGLEGVELFEAEQGIQFNGVQTKRTACAWWASWASAITRCWNIFASCRASQATRCRR